MELVGFTRLLQLFVFLDGIIEGPLVVFLSKQMESASVHKRSLRVVNYKLLRSEFAVK